MEVVVKRVLGVARFDRESYLWVLWNDRAGGDAALLVMGTSLLLSVGLAGFDLSVALWVIVGDLFFWLIYSGLAWAAAKFMFDGSGNFAGVFKIAGFAYPTRLLILAVALYVDVVPALLLGSAWFVAIVGVGMKEAMELPVDKGFTAAALGLAGYLVFASIFGRL